MSWPSWLACSGWFIHISSHPSAAGQPQDSESTPTEDRRYTTEPCNQPRPRPRCVRWGASSSRKGAQPPIFVPCVLWLNSWMDHDAAWYGGKPRPRPHCVRWGPSSPPWNGA